MARLTDTLQDPNAQARVIGGAPQGNWIESLADFGTGLLRSVGNTGSTSRGPDPETAVAEDELAMRIFQSQSNISLSQPETDHLEYARRMERAKAAGTLDAAAYDIRMTNHFAEMMRKFPNQASEMLAMARTEGVTHHLWREADDANKYADSIPDQRIKMEEELLTTAMNRGLYNPKTDTRESGMKSGLKAKQAEANMQAQTALLDLEIKRQTLRKPGEEAELKRLEAGVRDGVLNEFDMRFNSSLRTLYNLTESREIDPEGFAAEIDQTLLQMDMFGSSINQYLTGKSFTQTNADGTTLSYSYPKEMTEMVQARIKSGKDMLTALRDLPTEQAKRFIETTKLNAQVAGADYLTVTKEFMDVTGTTLPGLIEMFSNPTTPIADEAKMLVYNEISKTLLDMGAASTRRLEEATTAAQMPASSKDPTVAAASATHSMNMLKLMSSGTDENSVTKVINHGANLVHMLVNNYPINSLKMEDANNFVTMMKDTNLWTTLMNAEKLGGNPADLRIIRSNLSIATANFLEGVRTQSQFLKFDPTTKRFVPNTLEPTASRYGEQSKSLAPVRSRVTGSREAETANYLLDQLVSQVESSGDIIPPELLKESKIDLRTFFGNGGTIQGLPKAAGQQIEAQLKPDVQGLFNQTIDKHNFNTQVPESWMTGGQGTSPFGNQSSGGGGDPMASPEAWNNYKTFLSGKESSGNSNATNPDSSALGTYQFLESTWMRMAAGEDWSKGLNRAQILAKRADPVLQDTMLRKFTQENVGIMTKGLGRKPVGEELYLAHFAGGAGAVDVLEADPEAAIDKVLAAASDVLKAPKPTEHTNFRMFFKGVDAEGKPIPKTVAEFIQNFDMDGKPN